jgi:hypothetical protein
MVLPSLEVVELPVWPDRPQLFFSITYMVSSATMTCWRRMRMIRVMMRRGMMVD